MDDCLFCKIAGGEVPSDTVYEDDEIRAFLDIRPVNPGHTLVVPKKHYTNLYDLDDEILEKLGKALRDLSIAIKKALNADGINIEMNNDLVAGQVILHAHLHIVPRFERDGLKHWPGKVLSEEKMKGAAEKIRKMLSY
jgi:histidine triad (HIT) family protein